MYISMYEANDLFFLLGPFNDISTNNRIILRSWSQIFHYHHYFICVVNG